MAKQLIRIAALGLCLACSGALLAQVTTGTFYGIVADPSGGVVVGATVTMTNERTGIGTTQISDDRGEFAFNFVPIGSYTVRIELAGFKTLENTNLEIFVAQTLRKTFTLEVGQISERVTVTAQAEMVDVASTSQRANISTHQVMELPLPRRNLVSLGGLNAGSVAITSGGNNSGTFNFNGLGEGTASITVDGTDASASSGSPQLMMFGGFNYIGAISLEAVEEVQTSKGVISAEYARTLSGNLNIVTKSGTNQWHGSLFENYQGAALNARNQFQSTKQPFTFNQFGGSVGGPILRDKLFVFGVYEGYREVSTSYLQATVPTERLRTDMLARWPDYKLSLDAFPLPTRPVTDPKAATGIFEGNGRRTAADNHYVLKSDYWITQKHRISATYTHGQPDSNTPSFSPQNSRTFEGRADRLTASYTQMSARWSAETRFGYNKNTVDRLDTFIELKDPKKPETIEYGRRVPSINALGFNNGNTEVYQSGAPNWSFEQKVALQSGQHSLKFGGLLFYRQLAGLNIQGPDMRYANEADLLANISNRIRVTFGKNAYQASMLEFGFFIQDDWRASKSLVINMGLRYDYYSNLTAYGDNDGPPHMYNPDGIVDLNTFKIGPFRPIDNPFYRDPMNISPRLGLAYNPDGKGKNVFRAASGIMFSPIVAELFSQSIMNGPDIPFRSTFSRNDAVALNLKFPVYAEDILPLVQGKIASPAYVVFNPQLDVPYSINYYLGYQRALTSSMVLETAFVANHGVKFQMRRSYNQPDRVTGVRPNANLGESYYFDNSESTHYTALQTSFKRRLSANLGLNAHYTWGKAISYGTGDIIDNSSDVQSFFEVRQNRGPSTNDITHRFVADGVYQLPLLGASNAFLRTLLGGWQLTGIANLRTGGPLSIEQRSSAVAVSRPDATGSNPVNENYRVNLQYLNPAAFVKVPMSTRSGATIRSGSLGKGAVRGPGVVVFDFALSKTFSITERIKFQFRADMFNAFNHTNFSGVTTDLDNARFGQVSSASARQIQLNGRLTF